MKRTQLFIADIDPGFVSAARKAMGNCRDIEVIGTTDSGVRALNAVIRQQPDVLLTDLQLLELDGIALLREVRKLRRPPAVIVCTRFYSAASMDLACRHGASFFLCKPVELEQLPRLILECRGEAREAQQGQTKKDDGETRERCVAAANAILRQYGISSRLTGSAYLVGAILLAREKPLLLRNLSMGLYAEVAAAQDTTVSRVERSLRNAIAIGYERGGLGQVFPSRPTNREFITFMLEQLDDIGP